MSEERKHAPGSWCAVCTRDIGGQSYREAPLGRGNAMVAICSQCDTEPAVERDHLFGGSSGRGVGFGTGNRRKGNHL